MSSPHEPLRLAADELARQAFDFAARRPGHPLAQILRAKASKLSRGARDEAGLIEIRLLLAQAQAESIGE